MAQAIIIPKVQYNARHIWPTREVRKQLQRLMRNSVWRHTASAIHQSAGWLNEKMAVQAPAQGGIGLPKVDTHLHAMAASYVTRHALALTSDDAPRTHLTQPCQPLREAGLHSNMTSIVTAGYAVIEAATALPRESAERAHIAEPQAILTQLHARRCHAELHVDVSSHGSKWEAIAMADDSGMDDLLALPFKNRTSVTPGHSGSPITKSYSSLITARGSKLKELVLCDGLHQGKSPGDRRIWTTHLLPTTSRSNLSGSSAVCVLRFPSCSHGQSCLLSSLTNQKKINTWSC